MESEEAVEKPSISTLMSMFGGNKSSVKTSTPAEKKEKPNVLADGSIDISNASENGAVCVITAPLAAAESLDEDNEKLDDENLSPEREIAVTIEPSHLTISEVNVEDTDGFSTPINTTLEELPQLNLPLVESTVYAEMNVITVDGSSNNHDDAAGKVVDALAENQSLSTEKPDAIILKKAKSSLPSASLSDVKHSEESVQPNLVPEKHLTPMESSESTEIEVKNVEGDLPAVGVLSLSPAEIACAEVPFSVSSIPTAGTETNIAEVALPTSETSETENLEIENPEITAPDAVVPCSDAPNLSVQFTPIANTEVDVTNVSVSSTESPTSADLGEGNPEASDSQVKVLSLQTIKDPSAELFAEMFLNTASNGEVDIPSVATKDAEMFESTEIEVEKPEVTSQTSKTSKIVNLEIENPAITVSDDAVLCSDALNLSVQFAPVANTGEDVTDVSVSSTKSPISSDLEGGNPEDSCLQFKALSSQTIKGPSAELPAEISLNTASIGEVDIPNVATKDAEMLESTEIEVENPETISHEALSSSVIDVSSSEGEVDLEDAVPNTISQVIETALSTETSIESSLVSFSDVKMLSPPSINLPSDEPSLELIPIPAADEECDMQEIEASTITASVSADLDIA